jgi:hypothetical protein
MEETAKKALDLLEQSATFAKGFIEKHGPQAWDSVLWVYRVMALRSLILCIVTLTISWFVYRWWHRSLLVPYREWVEENPRDDTIDNGTWTVTAAGLLWIVPSAFAVFQITELWMWVSLFKPELKVAYDMFNKVTK